MYKIEIEKRCLKELKKLDQQTLARAFDIIEDRIAQNPYDAKALKGQYKGLYSYRFSNFRIIYEIIEKKITVVVLRVRHRKNVYNGM